jgi:hypothetical protein
MSGGANEDRAGTRAGCVTGSEGGEGGEGVHHGSPVRQGSYSRLPPTPPRNVGVAPRAPGAPPRVDVQIAPPASPPRSIAADVPAPEARRGPSPAASPRATAIPADVPTAIPAKCANPFLSG